MSTQPVFIITQNNKRIKHPHINNPSSIQTVDDFKELIIVLEDYIKKNGINWIYLCFIINDNDELISLLSLSLYQYIVYPINTIGNGANIFWNKVVSSEDYYYLQFVRRKFPSKLVSDVTWRIINDRLSRKNKTFDDYPNLISFRNRYDVTNAVEDNTNYNSIGVYATDQYYYQYTSNNIYIICSLLFKLKQYGLLLKLWCKLLINYQTVHLIFNNYPLWKLMDQIINKTNVYKKMSYALFYGLFILDREEMVSTKNITSEYRFVFDMNLLRQIPFYNYDNVNYNYWNTYVVGSKRTTDRALFHVDGYRSITSKSQFNKRFAIATNSAFNGINLKKYGAVITGSILAPLAAYNPLEQLFTKSNEHLTDEEFTNYLNYYYPKSSEINKDELKNPFKDNDDDDKDDEDINSDIMLSDIDIGIARENMEDFIKKCKELYIEIKKNIPDATLVELATTSLFKFRITIPNGRDLDLFPMADATPFDLVHRFHLGTVRMFWDGQTLYAFKSCITTLLTGLCDSHGWISCNSSAPQIVLKNAQRGYSTLINRHEEEGIIKYMAIMPKWNIWNKECDKKNDAFDEDFDEDFCEDFDEDFCEDFDEDFCDNCGEICNQCNKENKKETIHDIIDDVNSGMDMNVIGSFTSSHTFFNQAKGIRWGLINNSFENGGKLPININDSLSYTIYDKPDNMLNNIILQCKNDTGSKIMQPVMSIINDYTF